jgi:glycosyltransferase involved in cell wall biosynthesis
MHIGIMPLEDSEVEWGKCAFKAIQYMSLGIPPVVSPVGANCTVVQNNINGFWADSPAEWFNRIEELLVNRDLREEIGIQARKRIEDHYSVHSTVHLFYDLFSPGKDLQADSLK